MDSTRDISCSLVGGSVIKTDYGVTVAKLSLLAEVKKKLGQESLSHPSR